MGNGNGIKKVSINVLNVKGLQFHQVMDKILASTAPTAVQEWKENSMERKEYIVRAEADIAVTVETSTPENIKELLECALRDVCDISAEVKNISIEEQGALPEHYKRSLYNAFTGGKG